MKFKLVGNINGNKRIISTEIKSREINYEGKSERVGGGEQ
jgi:hypothetical protein